MNIDGKTADEFIQSHRGHPQHFKENYSRQQTLDIGRQPRVNPATLSPSSVSRHPVPTMSAVFPGGGAEPGGRSYLRGVHQVHLQQAGLQRALGGPVVLQGVQQEGGALLDQVVLHEHVHDLGTHTTTRQVSTRTDWSSGVARNVHMCGNKRTGGQSQFD